MVLVVLAGLAALGVAAWIAAPAATGLEVRVGDRLRATGGRPVPPGEVAPALRRAVIATEDERFYHHHGIDLLGVLRALPYDVAHLSLAQGASTITEQLGKTLYLGGSDRDPWRKLEDAALALKLERRYSKAQILGAYLNSVYFGDGAYGIRAASERYFALAPRSLDLARATLLAGLIQAPSADDPLTHPAQARARQVDVLRSLVRDGFVTQRRAAAALARPLRLRGGTTLAPVREVDLAPGPAFVWWQLALGVTVAAVAAAVLAASGLRKLDAVPAPAAVRALAIVVFLLAATIVVRSFHAA